jgi:hypothetical protein
VDRQFDALLLEIRGLRQHVLELQARSSFDRH